MCLLLVAWRSSRFPLVIAANRDEYHERPTRGAHFWDDAPGVFAGRDLLHGGTWMGVHRNGRFSAVTNFREPSRNRSEVVSRGILVSDFLRAEVSPHDYLVDVARRSGDFDAFNLLAGDADSLGFLSSREIRPRLLAPGTYGVSNGDLDCPWPKVIHGKARMVKTLARGGAEVGAGLFDLLADRHVAPDEELPDTGIGIDWERRLAPAFVCTPEYGTRSSTVVIEDGSGSMRFVERTFDGAGDADGETVQMIKP